MELTKDEELELIDWAVRTQGLSLILDWLESESPPTEFKKLQNAFKKWLYMNPYSYNEFVKEYKQLFIHATAVENHSKENTKSILEEDLKRLKQ